MIDTRKPLSLVLVAVLAAVVRAQDVGTIQFRHVDSQHTVRVTVSADGQRHTSVEPSIARPALGADRHAPDAAATDAALPDAVTFNGRMLPGAVQYDLDGDGLLDAVGSDFFDVEVSLGHGNGTFGPPTHSGDVPFLQFMLVGDATGDGQPDVIAFDNALVGTTFTLEVLPGQGPTFGKAVSNPEPPDFAIGDAMLADLNGDGMQDVLGDAYIGSQPDQFDLNVAVTTGGGGYDFKAPFPFESGDFLSGLALADFDGDGTLDVAAAMGLDLSEVHVYTGHGDGSFDPTPVISALPLDTFPSLTAQDQDEDGVTDLLSVDFGPFGGVSPGLLARLHGEGGGNFSTLETLEVPGPGIALWGDVNGDGVGDAVVVIGGGNDIVNGGDSGLTTLLGDGAGGLEPPLSVGWPGQLLVPTGLQDFDGDGLVDVVFDNSFAHGHGDGTFEGSTGVSISSTGVSRIAAADMNLDGKLDIVATCKKKTKGLAVLLGHGDASFDQNVLAQPGSLELALGDLDGDGDPDLAVGGALNSPGTRTFLNDGTGNVGAPTSVLSYSAAGLDLGDVDGDGDLDLVVSRAPTADLVLLRGDGQGGMSAPEVLAAGGSAKLVRVLDLDADGLLDVATALTTPMLVTLAGTGGGAFGAPQPVALPITPESMTFADFNRDGAMDAAVAFEDVYGHSLHVLIAQAPGQFGPSLDIPEVWNVEALGTADVDRDGWTDLIAVSSGYQLMRFRGSPDGTFSSVESTIVDGTDNSMLFADFTGDGRTDVAVSSDFFDAVRVVPNRLADFPSLGYQHAAAVGTPHLETTGAPVQDEKVSFTATGVPAPALGALFLGLEFSPQPFAGGTLVPSPDVMLPIRAGVPLAGRWPDMPSGTNVYAQAWFAFGGEVAATNAIEAITP